MDETLVNQYGGLLNVPPYLLGIKPVIKANGTTIATGQPIGLGNCLTFNMIFRLPNKGSDFISNTVTAGDYSAIAIQYYRTPAESAGDKLLTLIENTASTDLDDLLGQLLYSIGISYFHHLDFEEELYAKNFQMIISREPSETIVTSYALTEWLFGMPYKVTEGGVGVDTDRYITTSFPFDGNRQRARDFMILSGLGSSAWENMILESFFNIPSVSAAKLLKMANQQDIMIFNIDSSNINMVLPQLQVSSDVIDDIRNSVNAGQKVIISKNAIQYNEWNGVGYIILNPNTGVGAYMISGNFAGGHMSKHPDASIRARSDWSALVTSATRQCIVQLADSLWGTPYVKSGESEECGFDCSGLVYYVFRTCYGNNIVPRLTSAGQHAYLERKKMTLPYSERQPGDILWSNNYHTGIYYGNFNGVDYVIHASGKYCPNPNDPNGWLPSVDLPPECQFEAEINVRICGKYGTVVSTEVSDPYFAIGKGVAPDIGRPVP